MQLFRQTRPREWSDVLVALGQMNLTNELVQIGKYYQTESIYRNEIEFHRTGSVKEVPQEKLEAGVKWRF